MALLDTEDESFTLLLRLKSEGKNLTLLGIEDGTPSPFLRLMNETNMKNKTARRHLLRQTVIESLGNTCACGSTHNLKMRFLDPHNPLKTQYSRNLETL